MGFSPVIGGGTTTAHTHSNNAGDGGALSQNATIISLGGSNVPIEACL